MYISIHIYVHIWIYYTYDCFACQYGGASYEFLLPTEDRRGHQIAANWSYYLWAIMWMLRVELRADARATSVFKHRVNALAPWFCFNLWYLNPCLLLFIFEDLGYLVVYVCIFRHSQIYAPDSKHTQMFLSVYEYRTPIRNRIGGVSILLYKMASYLYITYTNISFYCKSSLDYLKYLIHKTTCYGLDMKHSLKEHMYWRFGYPCKKCS